MALQGIPLTIKLTFHKSAQISKHNSTEATLARSRPTTIWITAFPTRVPRCLIKIRSLTWVVMLPASLAMRSRMEAITSSRCIGPISTSKWVIWGCMNIMRSFRAEGWTTRTFTNRRHRHSLATTHQWAIMVMLMPQGCPMVETSQLWAWVLVTWLVECQWWECHHQTYHLHMGSSSRCSSMKAEGTSLRVIKAASVASQANRCRSLLLLQLSRTSPSPKTTAACWMPSTKTKWTSKTQHKIQIHPARTVELPTVTKERSAAHSSSKWECNNNSCQSQTKNIIRIPFILMVRLLQE